MATTPRSKKQGSGDPVLSHLADSMSITASRRKKFPSRNFPVRRPASTLTSSYRFDAQRYGERFEAERLRQQPEFIVTHPGGRLDIDGRQRHRQVGSAGPGLARPL